MEDSEVRRNQKHFFVLGRHQKEESISSYASLGFDMSTCNKFINSVRFAFNSNRLIDCSSNLNDTTCSVSHFHTSDSDNISTSNPGKGSEGDGGGKNESMFKEYLSPSSLMSLRWRGLIQKRGRHCLQPWKIRLMDGSALARSFSDFV